MANKLELLAPGLAWMHHHRDLTVDTLAARYALPPRVVEQLVRTADAPGRARRDGTPIALINELPAHRIPTLRRSAHYGLGRHPTLFPSGASAEQKIALLSLLPCGVERRLQGSISGRLHAKEGTDGLYHLRLDGRSDTCHLDASHAHPVPLLRSRASARPIEVPENLRCSALDDRWGPAPAVHTHRDLRMVRIVDTLRSAQGLSCAACRKRLAVVVDHDHESGMVRGLLCTPCNVAVDSCAHLAGCGFAEYLNAPPAPAGIRHPRHRSVPSAPH